MQIIINPELKKLIPPLTENEYKGLEQSCINEGIRDKLVLWGNILIDGHNRHEIAEKHNLNFETIQRDFKNIEAVRDWMIATQLGKRNLTKEQKSYLRGLQYEREKGNVGASEGNENAQNNGEKVSLLNTTAKVLAAQHKTSDRTIKNDAKFAKAIDKIAGIAGDEIKNKILNREVKTTAKEINRIAALPEEKIERVFTAIKKGETTNLKESIHKAAALDIKETPELKVEDKKYLAVYADPPWAYGNTMPNYFDSQAEHYPLMTVKEIADMPVKNMVENNAVLFLWVPSPMLEEAFQVVNAWGFKYKTSFVWDKIKHNMGHYNSVRHELLLVCVRGSCQPQVRKLFDSVLSIERSDKHSEKPIEFREIIDTIYPKGNRIELFARMKNKNWDAYGNQI